MDNYIKIKEEKYKYYLDQVNFFRQEYKSISSNLDKLIFGLSSGTIVLSITFIDKIVSLKNINDIFFLKLSWSLLIITLVINLIAHQLVLTDTKKAIEKLTQWFEGKELETPDLQSSWGKIANSLNTISLISLIIGISFLAYFASINISQLTI